MSNIALIAESITFSYPHNAIPIIKNASITVNKGEFVGVLGNSGIGKSTLLRLLAGFEVCDSGLISINVKTKGGFLFQSPVLIEWLNLLGNLTFPDEHISEEDLKRCENILNFVGLGDDVNKHPSELSGGMRTRLQLARAFFWAPELLFLDEPFQGLDEERKLELIQYLKRLRQYDPNLSAVFVSHSIDDIVLICDSAYSVHDYNGSGTLSRLTFNGCFANKTTDAVNDLSFFEAVSTIRHELSELKTK